MEARASMLDRVGVVVIGRNEGERLRICLGSLGALAGRTVYVDSGSSDGSVGIARSMGVAVLELDPGQPFTAARGRNEGCRRLRQLAPGATMVQFVDGDCELVAGWIEQAAAWLEGQREVAAVCGRRRERFPRQSVYNFLCDCDWDTPVGETKACGGDVLVRIDAFEAVSGYRINMIAGEDPEFCVRLRQAGWRVWRLDGEMTRHDAAMTRLGQWWKRTLRSGYAFAQGARLHGAPPERHCVRESRSAWVWGLGLPLAAVGAGWCWGVWPAGLVLLLYPLQIARLALRGRHSAGDNWRYASFIVMGKIPEMLGQMKYLLERGLGAQSRLIEYK